MSKQSGFNMLPVSITKSGRPAREAIKVVVSLARKLHPGIIFMEEADAMFGTAQLLPHGVRWDHDG
jgi:hypothetical protein